MKPWMIGLAAGLLLAPDALQAQTKDYDDLLVRYVDEKYEQCLMRAERYVDAKSTRNDPLPYLYMSMCYYEMSKIPKYQEMPDYAKADREALKWASKYRKKDKELEYFHNYDDFWSDLNTMAQEMGMNHYESGPKEMSKARRMFQSMTRYYPENPGAWLMLALTQYNTNMARDAEESLKAYKQALEDAGSITRLPLDQRKLLKDALIAQAEYLESKGDTRGAREALEVGKDAFMDDTEFKGVYNSLH